MIALAMPKSTARVAALDPGGVSVLLLEWLQRHSASGPAGHALGPCRRPEGRVQPGQQAGGAAAAIVGAENIYAGTLSRTALLEPMRALPHKYGARRVAGQGGVRVRACMGMCAVVRTCVMLACSRGRHSATWNRYESHGCVRHLLVAAETTSATTRLAGPARRMAKRVAHIAIGRASDDGAWPGRAGNQGAGTAASRTPAHARARDGARAQRRRALIHSNLAPAAAVRECNTSIARGIRTSDTGTQLGRPSRCLGHADALALHMHDS